MPKMQVLQAIVMAEVINEIVNDHGPNRSGRSIDVASISTHSVSPDYFWIEYISKIRLKILLLSKKVKSDFL